MNFFARNFSWLKRPVLPAKIDPFYLYLGTMGLVVLLVLIGTSAGGSNAQPTSSQKSKSHSTSVSDNHYEVGQKVYCWDTDANNGTWFPCTVVAVENNRQQYFIYAPDDKGHQYFHVKPSSITASGTYKGKY